MAQAAAQMDANQQMVNILTTWQQLSQQQMTTQYHDTELDKIALHVGRCDGTSPGQIITWIDGFELAVPSITHLGCTTLH